MEDTKLQNILLKHEEWLKTKGKSGVRADFTIFTGTEYYTYDNRRVIVNAQTLNLEGVNLSNCDLSEAVLSGVNLRGADLSGARLFKANLIGTNLSEANLSGAQFQEANLQSSNFTGANANNTNFEKADFRNAKLNHIDLRSTQVRDADFSNAILQGVRLDGLDLRSIKFEKSDLTNAKLNNANLSDAILNGADMVQSELQATILERAYLINTKLDNANLRLANFQDANLEQASLDSAKLEQANFSGASFKRASLRGAVLNKCILIAVNFQGANLFNADLSEAVLHFADFNDLRIEVEETVFDEDGKQITKKSLRNLFTNIKEVNWKDADVASITISKNAISSLPIYIKNSFEKTFNIPTPKQNIITRSINFPKGYEQAGMSILAYFNDIVRNKYKDINVQISIKQDGPKIEMIVETPEGKREIIEETLYKYGLVVTGQLSPDALLDDKYQILELKTHLSFVKAQLESNIMLQESKNEQYVKDREFFENIILKLLDKPTPTKVEVQPIINVNTTSTVEQKEMNGNRYIETNGGNYVESNDGTYVQGNYQNMNESLHKAAPSLEELVIQLEQKGISFKVAQEKVAKDLSNHAIRDKKTFQKLTNWSKSLLDSTVSDVVKGIVKLAIKSVGIPLP